MRRPWRMHLNNGYATFQDPNLLLPQTRQLRGARVLWPKGLLLPSPLNPFQPGASTRAPWRSRRRGATATESTFALLFDSPASSAVANHRIHIIFAMRSPAHLAGRRAMNSLYRSAASTIERFTGWVMSVRGGRRPVSTHSRRLASSGRRRAPTTGELAQIGRSEASIQISPRAPASRRLKTAKVEM